MRARYATLLLFKATAVETSIFSNSVDCRLISQIKGALILLNVPLQSANVIKDEALEGFDFDGFADRKDAFVLKKAFVLTGLEFDIVLSHVAEVGF
jgi:hypothetical protein